MFCIDFRKRTPLLQGKVYTDIVYGGTSTGTVDKVNNTSCGYLQFTGLLKRDNMERAHCGFDIHLDEIYNDGSLFQGVEIGIQSGSNMSQNIELYVVLRDYIDVDVDDVNERFMAPLNLTSDFQSFRLPWTSFKPWVDDTQLNGLGVDVLSLLSIGIETSSNFTPTNFDIFINYIKWYTTEPFNRDYLIGSY